MNCTVCIFGELSSGYTQYPEDSTSLFFKKLYPLCKATTQIAIHRDNSLMYYCYIRKLKGKKYIGTLSKYYFSDLGIRNAILGFRQQEENHIMENIIYNELVSRGYRVDVGNVLIRTTDKNGQPIRKSLEVDFVVNEGSQRYYIQSALDMPNQEKVDQEKKVLTEIPDSFKKIIVVKDRIKLKRDEKGIVTMSIFDFLLNPDAINL